MEFLASFPLDFCWFPWTLTGFSRVSTCCFGDICGLFGFSDRLLVICSSVGASLPIQVQMTHEINIMAKETEKEKDTAAGHDFCPLHPIGSRA